MTPIHFTPFLLAALLLGGCATRIPKDTASPYYQVPVGSMLKIHRMIEVPPVTTRLFFQNGKVSASFNHYVPNCNIEVYKRDNYQVQLVKPGEYRIFKVQKTSQEVVRARRLQVAAQDWTLVALSGGGEGGNSSIYEGYHLWLEGLDPNVMRLSCRGVFADPSEAYPPSIDEMRQALGEIMTMDLAQNEP